MRRDVLDFRTKHGEAAGKRAEGNRKKVEMIVEPDLDEPTWEVRHPTARRRRMTGRTRAILSAAAAAAVMVNAGAAWAYWRITGSDTGRVGGGAAVELQLRGRSDFNKFLTPGSTGNLTVTVTNDAYSPIHITSVSRGIGNVIADDEHREAGCKDHVVTISRDKFEVSWDVQRNTIGAFTVADGLTMVPNAPAACEGATFMVPVQVNGFTRAE